MTNASSWTPQETRTMYQNLHLKPQIVASVLPCKTHTQIARKRRSILAGKFPIDAKHRQMVTNSLKTRRWSEADRVTYIRAATGDMAAREILTRRGLWYNGVCKGGQ